MKHYAAILEFIRDMNITGEDLIKGKIKIVYEKIIYNQNVTTLSSQKWGRIHCSVLPNYLKTFNFKLCHDLLPCKTKYAHFALDNNTGCNFCITYPDTVHYIYVNCVKLKKIWSFLDKIMEKMNFEFRFVRARELLN